MRLWAPTFPALVVEAMRAFDELVPASIARTPSDQHRELRLDAPDRATALVSWLNELAYLSETELWLPVEADVDEHHTEGRHALRIRARGHDLAAPFVLVKAATLHGAEVSETPAGLVGEVTLDI